METNIERKKPQYKRYSQEIELWLPVHLKSMLETNLLVQIIDSLIEGIDISELERAYSGGGSPSYHPKMMLKVWLYGFCKQVYTSRVLAGKLQEDLAFIWLSGNQKPCFKTLSDFRGNRMKDIIETVFVEMLYYLHENKYIDLDDLYIDGSKWAANSNKYKVVWRKNTERFKSGVLNRIEDLLSQAAALQAAEDARCGNKNLSTVADVQEIKIILSSSELEQSIRNLNSQLSENTKSKELEKISKSLEKEHEKLKKYELQEQTLAGRNSYSHTDTDATALRMKNEELLPGYNPQITTTNQFIVNATVHQNASDSPTLEPHLTTLKERVKGIVREDWKPDATTDAGYGSEENYVILNRLGFTAYVKYPSWYREVSGQLAKDEFKKDTWAYNYQEDSFLCPAGKELFFKEQITRLSENGYARELHIYEAQNCKDCPLSKPCRGETAQAQTNRTMQISWEAERLKNQAAERLNSEEGKEKRSKRPVEVETAFGDMKYNMKHRRFILRSKEKVNIEFLLLAMAHNFRKLYCIKSGIWKDYYAQRAAKKAQKTKKRA